MSTHPSLRSAAKDKKHRSVLKRYERLTLLKEKELWKEDTSVYGLPKVKVMKFKVKKEKPVAAAAEGAEGAAGAAAPAAAAAPKAAPGKDAAKPAAGADKKK